MSIYDSLLHQVGITDEVTICYCCGKSGLTRTVVFKATDEYAHATGDDYAFLGTTCATNVKAFKGVKTKVNKFGRSESEEAEYQYQCSIKIRYAKILVSRGWSLENAWNWIRAKCDEPNGFHWLVMDLNFSK